MDKLTHEEIFNEFCEWNADQTSAIVNYKPWGGTSIVIWLDNGNAYKVKRHAHQVFTIQRLSEEDINKKFGINK